MGHWIGLAEAIIEPIYGNGTEIILCAATNCAARFGDIIIFYIVRICACNESDQAGRTIQGSWQFVNRFMVDPTQLIPPRPGQSINGTGSWGVLIRNFTSGRVSG